MSGHVEKLPSGNLRLRVYVGTDPETGRHRYRSRTIPKCSDREAKRELARFVVECEPERGLDHSSTATTLGDLLGEWLNVKRSKIAPGTWADYRRVVEAIREHELAGHKIRKLRASHLDSFYADLSASGLGPARVVRYHNVISGALGQAVKWDWLDRNVAKNTTPPSVPKKEANAPGPDELARIIAEAEPDLRAWLILAADTGMRPGELAALRWSDLDLGDDPAVTVRRAIGPAPKGTAGPGGLTGLVEKDTKTHRARPVSIDAGTAETLRAHRRVALERAIAVGLHVEPEHYVFTFDETGRRPWRPDSAGARFRRIAKRLGLGHVKPYGTRHFAATQLLASGVDPRTVAHRLGHSKTSTTTDVYAHVVKARDQDAAAIIGDVLRSAIEETG